MNGNLVFWGRPGAQQFIDRATGSTKTEHDCEQLYDIARGVAIFLVRANAADQEELTWWIQCFERVGALYSDEPTAHAKKLAAQLEVLADELKDQRLWSDHYRLDTLQDMFYSLELMKALRRRGPLTVPDALNVMGISEHGPIAVIYGLRLIEYTYPTGDDRPHLALTAQGERYLALIERS